jgi:hypothetical protein
VGWRHQVGPRVAGLSEALALGFDYERVFVAIELRLGWQVRHL